MKEKVQATITRYHLLDPGERVVVGFSGGIDSVCLLHLLHSLTDLRLDLWALYINHSLRPAENRNEEELLRQVGENWGVHTREIVIDIPARLREKPQSMELLAREERYRIFRSFLKEIGASKVALGHHRDDQAETVLYRIIRGTGIDGLAGIPVCRDGIFIRPLLAVTRNEIRQYAAVHDLRWQEDSSNRQLVYRRNRIRHQLIPEIAADFNPGFKDALVRLSELAAEQRDFMETILSEYGERVMVREPGRIGLRMEPFTSLHPYLQYGLLKRLVEQVRPGYRVEIQPLRRLREKLQREGLRFRRMQLPKYILVYREREILFLEDDSESPNGFGPVPLNTPGTTLVSELNFEFRATRESPPSSWKGVGFDETYLELGPENLPLKLRSWQPGDAFRPLGTVGSQKLHDFFINNKIPRRIRKRIPLLVTADGRIAWVAGWRPSEEFKVRSSTAEVWHITITGPGNALRGHPGD